MYAAKVILNELLKRIVKNENCPVKKVLYWFGKTTFSTMTLSEISKSILSKKNY